jgi:signal transduction histidine kinase
LISANREVVEHARTQVGNLAHVLKTPLSVIVNEFSADPSSPLAAKVEEQAAVMRDQLSFYLNRARAAVRARTVGRAADVTSAVEALVRTFEKIYGARAICFATEVPETIRFQGERQDFDEMVGNLIDNAGKWALSGVAISVVPKPRRNNSERRFFSSPSTTMGQDFRLGCANWDFRSLPIWLRSTAASYLSTKAQRAACAPC